jgi:hypothetical protein
VLEWIANYFGDMCWAELIAWPFAVATGLGMVARHVRNVTRMPANLRALAAELQGVVVKRAACGVRKGVAGTYQGRRAYIDFPEFEVGPLEPTSDKVWVRLCLATPPSAALRFSPGIHYELTALGVPAKRLRKGPLARAVENLSWEELWRGIDIREGWAQTQVLRCWDVDKLQAKSILDRLDDFAVILDYALVASSAPDRKAA